MMDNNNAFIEEAPGLDEHPLRVRPGFPAAPLRFCDAFLQFVFDQITLNLHFVEWFI